jgi:hypothetical protein
MKNKKAKSTMDVSQIWELRPIDAIRAKADKSLVDVACGPMNLSEVEREIRDYVAKKSPEYLVVLIEKRPDLLKYHTTIYVSKEDFKKSV